MGSSGAKEKAKQLLEADLERVREELAKKTEDVDALSAEEKCLQSTLAQLEKDHTRKRGKPAAKKADVVKAAIAVLEAGPLSVLELQKAVSERLRPDHSLSGFSVCFKEAIKSPEFAADTSGIRLAKKGRKAEGQASKTSRS